MEFYYHFGNNITEHDKDRIISAIRVMHNHNFHKTLINIEEIVCKINETGTKFCRGQLDIDYHVFYYLRKNISIYVLDNDDIIVGIITFYLHADGTICIDTLCTPHSNGNGKRLLNIVKQIARNLRIKTICVSSTKNAVGFYTKMHFKIDPNHIECSPCVDMLWRS